MDIGEDSLFKQGGKQSYLSEETFSAAAPSSLVEATYEVPKSYVTDFDEDEESAENFLFAAEEMDLGEDQALSFLVEWKSEGNRQLGVRIASWKWLREKTVGTLRKLRAAQIVRKVEGGSPSLSWRRWRSVRTVVRKVIGLKIAGNPLSPSRPMEHLAMPLFSWAALPTPVASWVRPSSWVWLKVGTSWVFQEVMQLLTLVHLKTWLAGTVTSVFSDDWVKLVSRWWSSTRSLVQLPGSEAVLLQWCRPFAHVSWVVKLASSSWQLFKKMCRNFCRSAC